MDNLEVIETGLNNVFFITRDGSGRLATKSLVPGGIRGENTLKIGNEEYSIWDPYHSKLAAILLKGASVPLKRDSTLLYLGAAHGTTACHVSDIVSGGNVFAVEFSPRAMKDFIHVCDPRMNLIPILADARHPETYRHMITQVDMIYQDVAQRDQAGIANMNAEHFLKKRGHLILMIKTMSIDSSRKAYEVSRTEIKKLGELFNIKEQIDLEPFHSDHMAVIAQKI